VIVGHLDTFRGRDIFYNLDDMRPGDEILVYDADGDVAVFAADAIERRLKTDLPATRIWQNTAQPLIRLITCGGQWNYKTRHYLSNVIVYGHLVE
jgi:sortase (surface protein transpeptidase)